MIPAVYDELFKAAALKWLPGRDWRLLKAQGFQESRMNPAAVSPVGAAGVMQFMPKTWEEACSALGYTAAASPFDPALSINAGGWYMGRMLDGWKAERPEMDRYALALASYNAGFGNLLRAQKAAGGANDYASIVRRLAEITGHHSNETVSYVSRILGYWVEMITSQPAFVPPATAPQNTLVRVRVDTVTEDHAAQPGEFLLPLRT